MLTEHLKRALALAQLRRGFCAPNPAVGAVLVNAEEQVLAEGYHWASGHPHAEADALSKVTHSEAKDATLYVTLEPCCHLNKKTPPCTELLIERGIRRVFYGFRDPNPEVAGRGEQRLRTMGIECQQLALPEIDAFYTSYQFWRRTSRPYVTAKLALSLDGKIAGPKQQRITISGPAAQQFTHLQRKQADAILSTAFTIQQDNPLLNVRLADTEEYRKPIYLLDSQLITSVNANIFKSSSAITLFHRHDLPDTKISALEKAGAHCHAINFNQQGLDLNEVLTYLGREGVHDLWIEAGGRCFNSFLQENLLQRAFIYLAPKWLGEDAYAASIVNPHTLANAQSQWHLMGTDAVCELRW